MITLLFWRIPLLKIYNSLHMATDALKSVPFPLPSLDRPFGVELWPIFDKLFTSVRGYGATDFRFVPGKTPISTFRETAAILVSYYIIVFGGREVMKGRQPLKLNGLFMLHNFYLTAISAVLLSLFTEQLVPTVWRNGVFYAICNEGGGWTKPLVTLYYVSYLV